VSFISAGSLTQMRRQRAESLIDTCSLRPWVEVSDNAGGFTQTWATSSSVACAVATSSGTGSRAGGTMGYPSEARAWTVALGHTQAVKPADRIVWSGRTLEVVSVDLPGTHGIQVTAYCVEVD
jgi:head-tail adaptor